MDHELPLQPGITEKKTQESRNQSCAKLMKEAESICTVPLLPTFGRDKCA